MSKKKSWRDDLPHIDWQSAEHRLKAHEVLNGEPVAYLKESEIYIPYTGNRTELSKWVHGIFKEWSNGENYGIAENPIIGDIILNKRSADNDIGHGNIDKYKYMTFFAIKAVCEKGTIIALDDTKDNERSYFISAPVHMSFDNKEDDGIRIVTVLVHKDMNIQRLYLHSVTEKEKLLMPRLWRAENVRTSSRQHTPSLTPAGKEILTNSSHNGKGKHPNSLRSEHIHNLLHCALTINSNYPIKKDKQLLAQLAPSHLETPNCILSIQSILQCKYEIEQQRNSIYIRGTYVRLLAKTSRLAEKWGGYENCARVLYEMVKIPEITPEALQKIAAAPANSREAMSGAYFPQDHILKRHLLGLNQSKDKDKDKGWER